MTGRKQPQRITKHLLIFYTAVWVERFKRNTISGAERTEGIQDAMRCITALLFHDCQRFCSIDSQ